MKEHAWIICSMFCVPVLLSLEELNVEDVDLTLQCYLFPCKAPTNSRQNVSVFCENNFAVSVKVVE